MNAKTTLLACLLAGFTLTPISAQTLKKGALISISTYTSILNPDVTMNQFLDFYMNKYIPEFEKNYPGIKLYVLTGDRGEKKNQFGYISYFESVEVRDKYWPPEQVEGSVAARAAEEKMKALNEELGKYFVGEGTRTYTDWIIK